MSSPKQTLQIDDHKLNLSDLYQRYSTDPETGLTDAKAKEIYNRDGPNMSSQPKKTSDWMKFCMQIFGGFPLLFWICASLCFIVHSLTTTTNDENASISYLWLGIVLIVVVIITGLFSYYQESKSLRIMDAMTKTMPQQTLVIRNGQKKKINIEDLVIGDIIEVNSGDSIPADIRIVESSGFKVDMSSLTGESEPQMRSTRFTNENPLETNNLAFRTTCATEGTAKGLVIRTGDRTTVAHILNLLSDVSTGDKPMNKEISHAIHSITSVTVSLGILLFIMALSLGYPFIESVILLIVIIIANAPKGLSITVTICLTLTAKTLGRKNCLVKNLQAVETLGSTSIICVDKTGTLTLNQQVIQHMWFDNKIVKVDISENRNVSTFDKNSYAFLALTRCAMLGNRADFKQDPDNLARPVLQRECDGNASEAALLKCVELLIGNASEFRRTYRKVCEIPFNSSNKYQVSVHEMQTNNESEDNSRSYLLVMKGSPERIIERCSTIYIDGKDVEMNDYWKDQFNNAYLELGNLGERVLGFCDLRLSDKEYPVMNCRSAGIKVIMVTGDHPITAKAVARSASIISERSEIKEDIAACLNISPELVNSSDTKACVIHGNDLKQLSSAEMDALLRNYTEIVFARVSPQQKAFIVEACQRQGAIVTMIGDSINDSPALQKADVGVAMGIAGSTISKQAAEIILMDDNFASIVTCIEQGRLMFDNLKKSIAYTMTSNIVKLISVLICLLTNIPLAWGITTVLCIDFMNIIGAISLAYEKAETDVMKRRPRDPQHDRFVNKRLILIAYGLIGSIQAAAGLFAYLLIMIENGFSPWESKNVNNLQNLYARQWTDEQRNQLKFTCYTAFFITIIICQWATLIIFKTRRDSILQQSMKNLILNFGIISETILVAITSYILYSNTTLNTYSLKFCWWLPALAYVFLILIFDEVRKYICRKYPGGVVKREISY